MRIWLERPLFMKPQEKVMQRERDRERETKESRAAKDRKGTMEIRKGKL